MHDDVIYDHTCAITVAIRSSCFFCFEIKIGFLTLSRPAAFGDFPKKPHLNDVALRGNFSGPVCSKDPIKVSKDTASLLV